MSNIKQIVERVENKDKAYNACVAKVSDREIKINLLKDKIMKLDQDFVDFKTIASVDTNEMQKSIKKINSDKEDDKLCEKEQKLKEVLEEMKEKNEYVEM